MAGTNAAPRYGWILSCSIGLPLAILLHLGQDANWDLQNYHLYNPFAWLHGRLLLDIAPAQLQSWHNPLLDIPFYLLVQAGSPGWLVGLWLTLPFMAALYCLLRSLQAIHPACATPLRLALLCAMAASGAAAWSELGTTLNDGFVAAGVFAALWLLLRKPQPALRDWLFAGLLAGATAGLKLTAAIYCIGLAAAACTGAPRTIVPRLLALLAGGTLGFIATYGYWGWLLYGLHGNPAFPYFNDIFRSPDALPLPHADERFRPATWVDALLVPLRLLGKTHRYSELGLRDPRLLLGMLCFPAALLLQRRRGAGTDGPDTARIALCAAFFFASLAVWLFQYGIYRYALALEMLACLPLVLVAGALPPRWSRAGLLAAAVLVIAVTYRPDWSRQRFSTPMVRVDMPPLPSGSLVVISSLNPLAFAATALPDDIAAVAVYDNFMPNDRCTGLQAESERRIAASRGPLWLLRSASPDDDAGQALAERRFGLRVSGACRPLETSLAALRLCPLQRLAQPFACARGAPAPGR